ncbi:MAG: Crp/Fnr family transcriptional regulator [Algoriphagus sp.]|nr:Crp/Fnr family transcriptional regulator [Algoriphagus sp.]
MNSLADAFSQFPFLDENSKNAFMEKIQFQTYQKGELLEEAGKPCRHLHYLVEGSARSFYLKENKDVTVSFSLPKEFITSMHSFITQKPSNESIEALEKTTTGKISQSDLWSLFDSHPNVERTYRMILERYFIALEEQLIFSKFKSARERYLELFETRPKIIQKASVGQIASYLDMSIETLSRIRGKI